MGISYTFSFGVKEQDTQEELHWLTLKEDGQANSHIKQTKSGDRRANIGLGCLGLDEQTLRLDRQTLGTDEQTLGTDEQTFGNDKQTLVMDEQTLRMDEQT